MEQRINEKDKLIFNKKIENLEKQLKKSQDKRKKLLGFENGVATKDDEQLNEFSKQFLIVISAINSLQQDILVKK